VQGSTRGGELATISVFAVGACCNFAVLTAVEVVPPHRHIALLRQRMGNRTGIGTTERLEFVGGKLDDDPVLDGIDP
jgi:hypothetical protein